MSSRSIDDLNKEMHGMAIVHKQLCAAEGVELLTSRKCTVCFTVKQFSEFVLKRGKPKGRCKACDSIYSKANYEKNKQKRLEQCKKYRSENKTKLRIYFSEWRRNNKNKCNEYAKKYRENNKDKHRESVKKWGVENIQKKRKCYQSWASRNPDKVLSKNAKRRAAELNAIPVWFSEADEFVFSEALSLAKLREVACGFKWEVDHIVPLISKEVSGFHCMSNFRVIPAIINRKKGNRRTSDWES